MNKVIIVLMSSFCVIAKPTPSSLDMAKAFFMEKPRQSLIHSRDMAKKYDQKPILPGHITDSREKTFENTLYFHFNSKDGCRNAFNKMNKQDDVVGITKADWLGALDGSNQEGLGGVLAAEWDVSSSAQGLQIDINEMVAIKSAALDKDKEFIFYHQESENTYVLGRGLFADKKFEIAIQLIIEEKSKESKKITCQSELYSMLTFHEKLPVKNTLNETNNSENTETNQPKEVRLSVDSCQAGGPSNFFLMVLLLLFFLNIRTISLGLFFLCFLDVSQAQIKSKDSLPVPDIGQVDPVNFVEPPSWWDINRDLIPPFVPYVNNSFWRYEPDFREKRKTAQCSSSYLNDRMMIENRDGYYLMHQLGCGDFIRSYEGEHGPGYSRTNNIVLSMIPGDYIADIYFWFPGHYAKSEAENQCVSPISYTKAIDGVTYFPTYSAHHSYPWPTKETYVEIKSATKNLITTYQETPRLRKNYKGRWSNLSADYLMSPWPNVQWVDTRVPNGGGDSDVPKECISYDVDSKAFRVNAVDQVKIQPVDINIKQNRPFAVLSGCDCVAQPKKLWIYTVNKTAIWLSKKSVYLACQELALKKQGKQEVLDVSMQALRILQDHTSSSQYQLQSVLSAYFEETETGISNIIASLEKYKSKLGSEGQYLIDYLKSLSLLKKYPELSVWSIEKIFKSPDSFWKMIENLQYTQKISPVDGKILSTFAVRIKNPVFGKPVLVTFDRRLDEFLESIPGVQMTLEDLDQKARDLLGFLSTRNNEAYYECKKYINWL